MNHYNLDQKQILSSRHLLIFYLCGYTILSLFFLPVFPYLHSDEIWLSGLSRNIVLEVDLAATESFFDLYPRSPHAIRILYHLLQAPFVLFAYSLFSVRLISLIFGLASLVLFYRFLKLFLSPLLSLFFTILFSVDIQFIYSSHFARQEIVLLFFLLWGLVYIFSAPLTPRRSLILGSIPGIAIGIHPNAFIIFIFILLIFLYRLRSTGKRLTALLVFLGTVIFWGGFFIFLSLLMDPDFFSYYLSLVNEYGVTVSLIKKILGIVPFYGRLYHRISGTYYLPDLRLQFLIFPFSLFLSLLVLSTSRKRDNKLRKELTWTVLLGFAGINLGLILIGKYSQPSFLFLVPLLYISLASWTQKISGPLRRLVLLVFFSALAVSSFIQIYPYKENRYKDYLYKISRIVPPDSKTLANLNTGFYFAEGALLDYRNLAFLIENRISLEDYIYDRNIEYLFFTDEIDFIYENRPLWNGLYGNVYPYYSELKEYLSVHCDLVGSFSDPYYGTRIVRYQGKRAWRVYVYRVKDFIVR